MNVAMPNRRAWSFLAMAAFAMCLLFAAGGVGQGRRRDGDRTPPGDATQVCFSIDSALVAHQGEYCFATRSACERQRAQAVRRYRRDGAYNTEVFPCRDGNTDTPSPASETEPPPVSTAAPPSDAEPAAPSTDSFCCFSAPVWRGTAVVTVVPVRCDAAADRQTCLEQFPPDHPRVPRPRFRRIAFCTNDMTGEVSGPECFETLAQCRRQMNRYRRFPGSRGRPCRGYTEPGWEAVTGSSPSG